MLLPPFWDEGQRNKVTDTKRRRATIWRGGICHVSAPFTFLLYFSRSGFSDLLINVLNPHSFTLSQNFGSDQEHWQFFSLLWERITHLHISLFSFCVCVCVRTCCLYLLTFSVDDFVSYFIKERMAFRGVACHFLRHILRLICFCTYPCSSPLVSFFPSKVISSFELFIPCPLSSSFYIFIFLSNRSILSTY